MVTPLVRNEECKELEGQGCCVVFCQTLVTLVNDNDMFGFVDKWIKFLREREIDGWMDG
jgi:hypothetical protein